MFRENHNEPLYNPPTRAENGGFEVVVVTAVYKGKSSKTRVTIHC